MKTVTVKGHKRKGKSVRTHKRIDKRNGIGPGPGKAAPVNSQGFPDGSDLNTGLEEGPTYHDLADKLKAGDRTVFRGMMDMAKSRKSAGISGDKGKAWNTHKSKDGKHFIHTHKTSGKIIRKKNPNWIQGDHADAQIKNP